MAAGKFSVSVDIGGSLNASLGAAVRAADAQVSSLARSVSGINTRMAESIRTMGSGVTSAGRKMQEAGRSVSASASAPLSLLAFAGGKMAYEFEKSGNVLQALGDATDEQRAKVEDLANDLNRKYPQTLAEIINTGNEMLKGGFSFEQMLGGLDQTLATAVIAEMAPDEVGNMMARTINSFQMPMATFDQAQASITQASDRMTYAAVKSTASLRDMGEMFRYVGGAMSAGGQDIDQATALAIAFAKNGTVASEAGIALRSAIVRMVKMPKQGLAALNRIGLNLNDYTQGSQPITADRVLAGLESGGIDASGAKDAISKLLADKSLVRDTARLGLAVTKAVQEALGSSSAIDASVIAENVNDSLIAAGNKIDVWQFLNDIQAKIESGAANRSDLARIFEGRHFARMEALWSSDLPSILAGVQTESDGYTQDRYGIFLKGIVGPTLALGAALEKLSVTLSKAVFPILGEVFDDIADGLQRVSDSNPALIKFAAFTGLATIALGPFLLVAGAAVRLLSPMAVGLMTLGRWATIGLAARLTAVAGGVRAIAIASALGAVGRLRAMAAGLIALATVSKGAALGAVATSIAAFGKKLLLFPITALKALVTPLVTIGALSAAGLAAIAAVFVGLGFWIANNWQGIKAFFEGFGKGFREALSPDVVALFDRFSGFLRSIFDSVSGLVGPLKATNTEWQGWGATVGGTVANAVNSVADAIGRVVGLLSSAIEKAKAMGDAIRGALANGGAEIGGVSAPVPRRNTFDLTPNMPPKVDGARARGGPVWRGGTFLVGENGPELFSPSRSGNIVPNHRLGSLAGRAEAATASRGRAPAGSISVSAPITIHVAGGDPHDIEQVAYRAVQRAIREAENEQRGLLSD